MTLQQPNLRPLNAGEILDWAFRLYRAHFWLFISIAAVIWVPLCILEVTSQLFYGNTGLIALIEFILDFSILQGALIWSISRIYTGIPTTITNAYKVSFKSFWMIIAGTLEGLATIIFLAMLLWTKLNVTIITFFGYSVLYTLLAPWAVVIPVIRIENTGLKAGIKRSWVLTGNQLKHVIGTKIIALLLIDLIAQLPWLILHYAINQYGFLPNIGPLILIIVRLVVILISTPLSLIITVILYYDLRVRREGYDLELALQATETPEAG